jgi:hypothetical protein
VTYIFANIKKPKLVLNYKIFFFFFFIFFSIGLEYRGDKVLFEVMPCLISIKQII